jgi:hypothetical protein
MGMEVRCWRLFGESSRVDDREVFGALAIGPVQYSYPGYFFKQISTWIQTFANLGVETRVCDSLFSYRGRFCSDWVDVFYRIRRVGKVMAVL